ncbi:Trypsin 5G1 [Harpegnathos saltator]|uniref:Trypsin 5G1 n=1 Tax=Harpegnathos saltator TaxID=610380 RepID=E2B727_HARSA|nr:Trypsin 5G1 [Harpegnathos saltator]
MRKWKKDEINLQKWIRLMFARQYALYRSRTQRNIFSVRSGTSFLYEGGTVHKVTDVIVHENFDNVTFDYDIALIKVTPAFTYGSSTKAVGLPQGDAESICKNWGNVCGWGLYREVDDSIDNTSSEELRCVLLPLVGKKLCSEYYKFYHNLTPRMTCYGFQEGVFDTCQGDSGAALVNKDNILLGITSWGYKCGMPYSPGVYTDVIFLQNWIKYKTEN